MNKYAVISELEFTEDMLGGVAYPVHSLRNGHVIIEYTIEVDPIGDWILFEGDGANVRCAEYLAQYDEFGTET